jgi:hypothetical protein
LTEGPKFDHHWILVFVVLRRESPQALAERICKECLAKGLRPFCRYSGGHSTIGDNSEVASAPSDPEFADLGSYPGVLLPVPKNFIEIVIVASITELEAFLPKKAEWVKNNDIPCGPDALFISRSHRHQVSRKVGDGLDIVAYEYKVILDPAYLPETIADCAVSDLELTAE